MTWKNTRGAIHPMFTQKTSIDSKTAPPSVRRNPATNCVQPLICLGHDLCQKARRSAHGDRHARQCQALPASSCLPRRGECRVLGDLHRDLRLAPARRGPHRPGHGFRHGHRCRGGPVRVVLRGGLRRVPASARPAGGPLVREHLLGSGAWSHDRSRDAQCVYHRMCGASPAWPGESSRTMGLQRGSAAR